MRLLVADLPDSDGQPLVELTRRMEIVRLGQDVDRTGRLSAVALARTRAALTYYAGDIRRWKAERVRMVATSATRDAANAAEFTSMVRDVLGVEPEVLTGDQEARLSFTGAVRGLPTGAAAPYLVVDIGGGSTELVAGGPEVYRAVSVDVGCVRMTERHLSDPPTREQIAAAEADVAKGIGSAIEAIVGDGTRGPAFAPAEATLIGLAGSVTTVAGIVLGLPSYQSERIHHSWISYDQVARVTADLLSMTRDERAALPVMHPGRADVIGAGALILRVVMEQTGAGRVLVSEHDILDGIAWSLA